MLSNAEKDIRFMTFGLFSDMGLDEHNAAIKFLEDIITAACIIIRQDETNGTVDLESIYEGIAHRHNLEPTDLKNVIFSFLKDSLKKDPPNDLLNRYLCCSHGPSLKRFVLWSTITVLRDTAYLKKEGP